ncbi:Leucine--tRNA ligase [Candidatus Westeberhardia cardiocondylae]|uniref:Leucine--tRNA ligase n=1 Tax=Candidatus Westeberhardia cardiocondylae TaxID=1594731 RepID=A0A0H5BX40_9ENTR|nr:leucine--tRNA ligase [Candidatus Westeberhardia cardiocondylae]CEN32164.1 Leucine--tRNA ligase [Candidatus Westeberhardia cardiocondylae]
MKKLYEPKKIESFVQNYWNKYKIFKVQDNLKKEKYYCLSMLPYPSGKLHMGHVRNYIIGDVISRYQRMLGKNVLQPIGWDAFGLPAEKAAITHNVDPNTWTYSNINYMRSQLKNLGISYDWDREITTCDPMYYKWEQLFFINLYEKGIVYKKKSIVNWCPKDKTVLANEQVLDGRCWRCHVNVTKKRITQWFIKITSYANQLYDDLNKLCNWPKKVINMQRNWIGRFNVFEIIFNILNSKETLKVYMRYPLMFMNATFVKITIDHPLLLQKTNSYMKIIKFIKHQHISSENMQNNLFNLKKNSGIFTGIYVIHPFSKENLPIWISHLSSIYCQEIAWIGSPYDDENDLKFAKKNNIPIRPNDYNVCLQNMHAACVSFIDEDIEYNLKNFDILNYQKKNDFLFKILMFLDIGKKKVLYKLRDWCVSRQRYWGVPIPMITLDNNIVLPVSKEDLPVVLPQCDRVNYSKFNLKNCSEWVKILYNGKYVTRETDTFDTFMESSWYFYRYTCPHYDKGILNPISVNYWLPVDQYIGGIEHATMHLLYCRFYHKLFRDAGLVNLDEPIIRLLCQGMVLSDTFYYISESGEYIWISPSEIKTVIKNDFNHITGAIDLKGNKLIYDGIKKMSKSKNNGIDPKDMIDRYGADTVRLFIMFAAPVDSPLVWKESGVNGMHRFLNRLWKVVYKYAYLNNFSVEKFFDYSSLTNSSKILYREMNETILKVTDDIDRRQSFNTAISAIIKLVKKVQLFFCKTYQDELLIKKILIVVVKMLYPFAPHICFFLWKNLGETENIDFSSWPKENKDILLINDQLFLVQINGKFRAKIIVPKNSNKYLVQNFVFRSNLALKYLKNKTIKKIVFVPNKLINFVLISK